MKRRAPRDLRQREMLLPIAGTVPAGIVWPTGGWQSQLVAVIAAAALAYGKAQVAVWAGSDQRAVENWIAGRNLPSLEAAVHLAQHLDVARRVLEIAMDSDPAQAGVA